MKRHLIGLAAAMAMFGAAHQARANDDVTIGRAVITSFAFTTLDIGQNAGIWEKEGLNLNILSFRGDAVLQQALTGGSADFGLGSGPAMGFHVKGAPATGVAVIAGEPDNMALCVPVGSPVKTLADLKGKSIGITTVGSLTDWLARELSRQQGWGSDGIRRVAVGGDTASVAAIRSGQVDVWVGELASCLQLQHDHSFNVALVFGDKIKKFYTHILFARDDIIHTKPELVRRVLHAWFSTVAYMRTHKQESMAAAEKNMNLVPEVASEMYDKEMAMMSSDGAFDPATLQVVAESLKELGILPEVPPISALYDGQFVPVKLQ